jgi:hypothetical protein
MLPADDFYASMDGPLQQGDILLAGVVRLVATDRYGPPQWDELDDKHTVVHDDRGDGTPLIAAAGPALVMITSHDCHMDKDWNRRVRELVKGGMQQDEAERQAELDDTLDRTFQASPLVRAEDLPYEQGNLLAGKVVGYLPVPPASNGLVPEAVADLTYRVTLDRLDVRRVASTSTAARQQLRYALARLDSLRAPEVGFRLEAMVGQRIASADFPSKNPLEVHFLLEDGTIIELLQKPGEPALGPARKNPPRTP